MESGAGRFTDFLLPPLTFHEYLDLLGIDGLVEHTPKPDEPGKHEYRTDDLAGLNRHFIDYLNFGGYPEAVSSAAVRSDPGPATSAPTSSTRRCCATFRACTAYRACRS